MRHPWSQNPGSFRVYDILVSLNALSMRGCQTLKNLDIISDPSQLYFKICALAKKEKFSQR